MRDDRRIFFANRSIMPLQKLSDLEKLIPSSKVLITGFTVTGVAEVMTGGGSILSMGSYIMQFILLKFYFQVQECGSDRLTNNLSIAI